MPNFAAHFYFSPRGRTGRQAYWLFGVIPLFMLGLLLGFAAGYFRMSRDTLLILLGLLTPLALWIWIALGSRRLHDIGVSAWWMMAVCVVPVLISFLMPERWAQLPALLATVALGLPQGFTGSNRYGPDPNGEKTDRAESGALRSNKSLERTRER